MRNQTARLFLLMTPPLFLLFPIAAITSVLESIFKSALYDNLERNMRTGAFEVTLQGHTTTTLVTLNINNGPTYAILGTCILGYSVAALGVAGVWQLRKVQAAAGHDRMWTWIMFIANLVMIGASLGIFGYASSVQARDKGRAGLSVVDIGKDGKEHTRETWACEIDRIDPNQHWAPKACSTAKAMRVCLIGLAVAAAMVFVSLAALIRSRGGLKWVFGGKGRYAGFQSVYEMQPPGPASPYVGPPGQQWVQQPVQQWHGQPIQQWSGQPVQQWPGQPVQQWSGPPIQQSGRQQVQQWSGQQAQQGASYSAVQVPKSEATVELRPVPRGDCDTADD